MAANGILIALFEMVLVYKLEGKKHPLHFASIGVILMGCSFILFNLFTGSLLLAVISMLIVTAGEMFSMPFMNTFWVSRTTSTNRGQYAALYTIAWSIGQIVGPYLGSITAQHLGFTSLWWIVGGISLAAAIGYKTLDAVLKRN